MSSPLVTPPSLHLFIPLFSFLPWFTLVDDWPTFSDCCSALPSFLYRKNTHSHAELLNQPPTSTTIPPLLLSTSLGGRVAPAGPDLEAPSVAEHHVLIDVSNNTDWGDVFDRFSLYICSRTQKKRAPKFQLQSGQLAGIEARRCGSLLELHNRESWREVNAWKSERDEGQKKGSNIQMLTERRNLRFATWCWGSSFWTDQKWRLCPGVHLRRQIRRHGEREDTRVKWTGRVRHKQR